MSKTKNVEAKVDHSRGLCHKPEIGERESIPLEEFKKDQPSCKCCGTKLKAYDDLSVSMQQLGVYRVVCPVCPPSHQ